MSDTRGVKFGLNSFGSKCPQQLKLWIQIHCHSELYMKTKIHVIMSVPDCNDTTEVRDTWNSFLTSYRSED